MASPEEIRRSAISFLVAGNTLPTADSTIDADDRAHVLGAYAGFTYTPAPPTPGAGGYRSRRRILMGVRSSYDAD